MIEVLDPGVSVHDWMSTPQEGVFILEAKHAQNSLFFSGALRSPEGPRSKWTREIHEASVFESFDQHGLGPRASLAVWRVLIWARGQEQPSTVQFRVVPVLVSSPRFERIGVFEL